MVLNNFTRHLVDVAVKEDKTLNVDFPWAPIVEASTFGVIWILALAGNVLITCTLIRRKLLGSPSNKLVFSVTLSNLVFSFCVFPCVLTSAIRESWIFGDVWCYVNGFCTVLVTVASSSTLAAIALDRYFAIVRPMQYSTTMTGGRANKLLIGSWSLGLACALPPCFGWSEYDFQPSSRACFLDWSTSLSYSIALLLITVLFPLISMLICYYAILQVASDKCRRINVGTMAPPMTPLERIRTLTSDFSAAEPHEGSAASDSQPNVSRNLRKNRFAVYGRKPSFSWLSSTSSINSNAPVKGMRTVCLVVAAFLLTWAPMVVLAILDICHHVANFATKPPQWLYVLAMWSLCAGSVTYPVLYGMYNRSIRKHLQRCLSPSNWRKSQYQLSQRRGSRWSSYSDYAVLRGRGSSASLPVSSVTRTFGETPSTQDGSSHSHIHRRSEDSGTALP